MELAFVAFVTIPVELAYDTCVKVAGDGLATLLEWVENDGEDARILELL